MRLIDADALMELYEMGEELKGYEKVLSVPIPVIQQNIKDMPTIEAEPVKRGRWVAVDGEEQPCDEWDCTACGQRRTFMCEMDADDMKECYPYCPNYGAKMDLEVDNA